jgi:hypothetical protein
MIPKKISAILSQDPEVAVKCRVMRGLPASRALALGVPVGGVVVDHDVQRAARVGLGDLLEKPRELLVAMPRQTGLFDAPEGHLHSSAANSVVVPVRT